LRTVSVTLLAKAGCLVLIDQIDAIVIADKPALLVDHR
jgi:hypothetical protein